MFTTVFQNATNQQPPPPPPPQGKLTSKDLDPRVTLHYGIPFTASILAFDPVQSLLAVGTLDGRIKVIGGDNIEGLLVSPKQLSFKNLEFLKNQGVLVGVSNGNEIQVWNLEDRSITSTLQWESNITAFSVIFGTSYMYVGDEYGMVSVLKYDAEEGKLTQSPYYVPTDVIAEAAGISSSNNSSVIGVLPQPHSQGKRLLIAYENGMIILWDVSEDKVVLVRGNKDLQLKGETVVYPSKGAGHEHSEIISEDVQAEKEISSVCWASNDGSVLAVGYVDGDIMFWNLPTAASTKDQKAGNSSNDVVKLQLSSGNRRIPVITLHWYADRLCNACDGRLFVYGGDEIGSEEVLTMLYLDWSSGLKSLKCIGCVNLKLNGSFADMVLLPGVGKMESCGFMIFVLTNPGQLHVYDSACLSFSIPQQEKKTSSSSLQYPMVVPIIEPHMTVGKLSILCGDGKLSTELSKTVSAAKLRASHTPSTPLTGSTKWPLTGGVPCHDAEDYLVERLYIAGYQDGSVRIWDATYPFLSLTYVLGSELAGIITASASAPVSALEFCSFTLSLAIGNASGMVYLYELIRSSNEASLNFVTETGKEVHILPQGDGPQCKAVFSFLNSPICNLKFANFGAKLAVGFESGRVAVLDISTLSVLILTDSLSKSSSPVMYLAVKSFSDSNSSVKSPKDQDIDTSNDSLQEVFFFMTKDAHIVVCDSTTGYILASQSIHLMESNVVSMYIVDRSNLCSETSPEIQSLSSPQNSETKDEPGQTNAKDGSNPVADKLETSAQTAYFGQLLTDSLVLICCEDALWLYPLKSLIQGHSNSIRKVNLLKPCCWITTFKKDEKECGLVVLYRTGDIEIRSLPNLEVEGETSLMAVLRWNFKTNMEKMLCSSERGQIVLINGSEFAFISLFAWENDFRIPQSLPLLHDDVLAASADATILSPKEKKEEGAALGILSSIVKGFRGDKIEQYENMPEVRNKTCAQLESIFSSPPFLKPSTAIMDDREVVELDIGDIDIEGPLVISSSSQTSSQMTKNDGKDKGTERERLFEGATTDTKPRPRTVEEIKAKYKKAGDVSSVSSAAAQARDKLAERQEKLEKLNERTQELQSGAENFADMAKELAKRMENRKWWHI